MLDNYHHLGDAASLTDGLHYDPKLKPYQVSADGKRSGTPDDMWAFTTRDPHLDFRAAAMFAAASRALEGYNDALAKRALFQSKRLMTEATKLLNEADLSASLQLWAATGDTQQLERFKAGIWKALDQHFDRAMQVALDAVPHMDNAYREQLRPYIEKYRAYVDSLDTQNPYGVPIGLGNWAAGGGVVQHGATLCTANKYYPDIIDKTLLYRTADFIYGCHPYHNCSLVAAVGAARPKAVFYGNNRADFSFIPGNMAPGVLFRKPDHFENFDDWPFLWGQNEGTIAGNTQYVTFGLAFKDRVKSK